MAEHPNVGLARRGFEAFAAGDRATIESLLHEDAVWDIPGHSPLAGEHRGRGDILVMRAVPTDQYAFDEFWAQEGSAERPRGTAPASPSPP